MVFGVQIDFFIYGDDIMTKTPNEPEFIKVPKIKFMDIVSKHPVLAGIFIVIIFAIAILATN